jgi:hypothetical protein
MVALATVVFQVLMQCTAQPNDFNALAREVCPCGRQGDIVRWMRRYSERGKREMDLADASLYWLAAETGLTEILTVDVSDFSRYRLPRGKAFTLL